MGRAVKTSETDDFGLGQQKVMARDNKMQKGYDVRAKLLEVLDNPKAPPQARAAAGRTLAEIDGLIGRHQIAPMRSAAVPIGQLSRAELEGELARLRDKCARKP
jgi:hypothetical protein